MDSFSINAALFAASVAVGLVVARSTEVPKMTTKTAPKPRKANVKKLPTTGDINIADYIDHTVLKPSTVLSDIEKLCKEAVQYKFAAVCVPPNFVRAARKILDAAASKVQVATVIGFPFGYSNIAAKVAEVEQAIEDGADELDMVANISSIKSHDWVFLRQEVEAVLKPIRAHGLVLKVIIESGILLDHEIIGCCEVYGAAGIDYLKTSTGYAEAGASEKAVSLFRAHLPMSVQIKASGGIRDYATALAMVRCGATRIGCSAGVAIVSSSKTGASAATAPAAGSAY